MMSLAVFVSLLFLYSLLSRWLEQTLVTAPIVFTVAGMLTIRLAITGTVLLSIFVHGLSATPGIDIYARRIVSLHSGAPELTRNDNRM
jgi:hypothetical protein